MKHVCVNTHETITLLFVCIFQIVVQNCLFLCLSSKYFFLFYITSMFLLDVLFCSALCRGDQERKIFLKQLVRRSFKRFSFQIKSSAPNRVRLTANSKQISCLYTKVVLMIFWCIKSQKQNFISK